MSSAEGKGYLHCYDLGRTAAEQGRPADPPADLVARDRDAWLFGHRDGTATRCPTCTSRHPGRGCFYEDFLTALGPLTLSPEEDRLLRWLAGWDSFTRDAFVSLLLKARGAALLPGQGSDRWPVHTKSATYYLPTEEGARALALSLTSGDNTLLRAWLVDKAVR